MSVELGILGPGAAKKGPRNLKEGVWGPNVRTKPELSRVRQFILLSICIQYIPATQNASLMWVKLVTEPFWQSYAFDASEIPDTTVVTSITTVGPVITFVNARKYLTTVVNVNTTVVADFKNFGPTTVVMIAATVATSLNLDYSATVVIIITTVVKVFSKVL